MKKHVMTSSMHIIKYAYRSAQNMQFMTKIRIFHLLPATQYLQIKQSIFSRYKAILLMEKSFQQQKRQQLEIQLKDQKIQYRCQHDDVRMDRDYSQEYIINLLDASSIFAGRQKQLKLERYLRLKMKDKPKQSLKYIMQKKQMFSKYMAQHASTLEIATDNKQQLSNQHNIRQRQQFPQHEFSRSQMHQNLIFIKVVSHKSRKCNITVYTTLGEIMRYYSNIYLKKKNGKLLNLIEKYAKSVIIVHDHSQNQQFAKDIPALIMPQTTILYTFFEIQSKSIIESIATKIHSKFSAKLQYFKNNIHIRTKKMHELYLRNIESRILQKIYIVMEQEQNYLKKIRGQVQKRNIILFFDAIIVNLWRQYKCDKLSLINIVNQLFNSKQNQIKSLIMDQKSQEHKVVQITTAQNCALCVSKVPPVERPRRTKNICSACSAQNQKPFYLCDECFESYHKSKDLFTYKRYQKRTKQLRLQAKKKNAKISEEAMNKQIKKSQVQINEKSSPQQIVESINKDVKKYLRVVEKLAQSNKMAFAQFALQNLMNSIIKVNNKHIYKIQCQRRN